MEAEHGITLLLMRLQQHEPLPEHRTTVTTVHINGPATFKYNGATTASFSLSALHSLRLILK